MAISPNETEEEEYLTCTEEKLASIKGRNKSDAAFMGFTHSMSAIAASLTLIALFPATVHAVLGVNDPWVLIMVTLTSAGFALVPDFDNTNAKAISAFGVVGGAMSTFFRTTSLIVQTTIRKKADDSDPDPHRGFWHTIPGALLIGLVVLLLTRVTGDMTLPYIGTYTTGNILGFFVMFFAMHLMFTGLLKPTMDKIKKQGGFLGTLLSFVFSAVATVIIAANFPENIDMWWLAVAAAYGCIVHILGDGFTTKGIPLFFPIVGLWKNKMWWNTRFPPYLKAGGTIENAVIIPLFVIISFYMIFRITVMGQ